MSVIGASSPFGSPSRTRVLLALSLLGSSFPRELSRALGTSLSAIQKAVRSLERDGLVAVRNEGRTRVIELSPRYFARAELSAYLARLAAADPTLREAAAGLRRRPRRTGKGP